MTRDELLERLQEIRLRQVSGRKDQERDHGDADEALLEYLDDPAITEAYGAIEMWSA